MEVPRYWRLKTTVRFHGETCIARIKSSPARYLPRVRRRSQDPFTFSGHGEVYSYTVMNHAPAGFENRLRMPYPGQA